MDAPEQNKTAAKATSVIKNDVYYAQRERIREILERRNNERGVNRINRFPFNSNSKTYEEKIAEGVKLKKEELANLAFEQNTKLKKLTLFLLFGFLAAETTLVFTIAFFQGFMTLGFLLDEWSFNLIIFATISQITTMLLVAVRHLFPNYHKE